MLLAAIAIGPACAPSYGTVALEPISTPPVTVTVRDFLVEMPAGIAVVVRASPESGNANEYDETYKLDLISKDRDVFTVYRREDRREFVFVGIAEGETCVEVIIDGTPHDCIDVTVTPPASG
jgi:hypothetical protein